MAAAARLGPSHRRGGAPLATRRRSKGQDSPAKAPLAGVEEGAPSPPSGAGAGGGGAFSGGASASAAPPLNAPPTLTDVCGTPEYFAPERPLV